MIVRSRRETEQWTIYVLVEYILNYSDYVIYTVIVQLCMSVDLLDTHVFTALYIMYANNTCWIILMIIAINERASVKSKKVTDLTTIRQYLLRCLFTVVVKTLLEHKWLMLSISDVFAFCSFPSTYKYLRYFYTCFVHWIMVLGTQEGCTSLI